MLMKMWRGHGRMRGSETAFLTCISAANLLIFLESKAMKEGSLLRLFT